MDDRAKLIWSTAQLLGYHIQSDNYPWYGIFRANGTYVFGTSFIDRDREWKVSDIVLVVIKSELELYHGICL